MGDITDIARLMENVRELQYASANRVSMGNWISADRAATLQRCQESMNRRAVEIQRTRDLGDALNRALCSEGSEHCKRSLDRLD
jgi:hypothetical protein